MIDLIFLGGVLLFWLAGAAILGVFGKGLWFLGSRGESAQDHRNREAIRKYAGSSPVRRAERLP